jgi:nuclear transport factor 2 (NTF2) superfamily protein
MELPKAAGQKIRTVGTAYGYETDDTNWYPAKGCEKREFSSS